MDYSCLFYLRSFVNASVISAVTFFVINLFDFFPWLLSLSLICLILSFRNRMIPTHRKSAIYTAQYHICVAEARFEQRPAAATVSRFSNNQQFSAWGARRLRGSQREALSFARFAGGGELLMPELTAWSS